MDLPANYYKKNIIYIKRRTSLIYTTRIDHNMRFHLKPNLILIWDVTDFSNVFNLIDQIKPDEIYNLAAQSTLLSFELAEYTAQTDSRYFKNNRRIRIRQKKKNWMR